LLKAYGVKFFVIDYIGLMPSSQKHDSREREIAYLSRFLKLTAQELGIIICALSQQNREGDIAESKALERDADFAFTIYKPSEDKIETMKMVVGGIKQDIRINEDDHLVTLKRSRHGKQGRQFMCSFVDNTFVERELIQREF
jgi:replicative DNA helicase